MFAKYCNTFVLFFSRNSLVLLVTLRLVISVPFFVEFNFGTMLVGKYIITNSKFIVKSWQNAFLVLEGVFILVSIFYDV